MINMIKGWNDNQELIKDYVQNQERFTDDNNKDAAAIFGISVGIFMFIFLISIILFFVSIYLLVVNWNLLPDWAKVIGLISLFFFPLVTIIVVLVGKEQGNDQGNIGNINIRRNGQGNIRRNMTMQQRSGSAVNYSYGLYNRWR